MKEKTYKINELELDDYATNGETVYVVTLNENGEKYYGYLMPYLNWVADEREEEIYEVSDIVED